MFFSRPSVPTHCNVLHGTRDNALHAARGDIDLAFCPACGMIYNASFDTAGVSYEVSYENALHHSTRFRQYAAQLAEHLMATYRLQRKVVLEIGSGDGHFLRLLLDRGASRGFGFDPSQRPDDPEADLPITLFKDYFRAASLPCPVDLICCRHVLEHIPKPQELLAEIQLASKSAADTVVYVEVPDTRFSLEQGGIWDIVYEHCSYFTPDSLKRLFRDSGYRVLKLGTAYEGQFLSIEALTRRDRATARDLTLDYSAIDVDRLAAHVGNFARQYEIKLSHWNQQLEGLRQQHRRVALWGAGTKGVMFLNSVEAASHIGCVVDVNPRKQGTYISGTGHYVTGPDALAEWRPDVVLLMNPIYRGEIAAILASLGISAELKSV